MRDSLQYALIVFTLVVSGPVFAEKIACPTTVTEIPVVEKPDGDWLVQAFKGERPLDYAGIFLADDHQSYAQVPDKTRRRKTEEYVEWNLVKLATERALVGCSYVGTTALVFKVLDPGYKKCVATYKLLPTGRRLSLKSLECN